MKKFVFTGILCFFVSLSFGQKKAVNAAKNEIKGTTPNFTEARSSIKEALSHPTTMNDAETWYVAGLVENKQVDLENTKEVLGKKPDEAVMYNALERIIPYFVKAAELDQLPDAKGKVKLRFLKDIRAIVKTNRPFYVNAGIYSFNNSRFQKAYEFLKMYGDIPDLDIYKEEPWAIAKNDTFELQMRYYAALAASQIPDYKASLAMLNDIKDRGYVENALFSEILLYKEIAREHILLNDSASFINTIKEGYEKFPSDEFFLRNMIQMSVTNKKSDEALFYLAKGIEINPKNGNLYVLFGQLLFDKGEPEEAVKNLKKAIELEPENVAYLSELGRMYFNLGVEKRKVADETSDIAKSKEIIQESREYFKLAMPLYEKVFDLDSTNKDAIFALRNIYYTFDMPQFKKMDELFNSGRKDE